MKKFISGAIYSATSAALSSLESKQYKNSSLDFHTGLFLSSLEKYSDTTEYSMWDFIKFNISTSDNSLNFPPKYWCPSFDNEAEEKIKFIISSEESTTLSVFRRPEFAKDIPIALHSKYASYITTGWFIIHFAWEFFAMTTLFNTLRAPFPKTG